MFALCACMAILLRTFRSWHNSLHVLMIILNACIHVQEWPARRPHASKATATAFGAAWVLNLECSCPNACWCFLWTRQKRSHVSSFCLACIIWRLYACAHYFFSWGSVAQLQDSTLWHHLWHACHFNTFTPGTCSLPVLEHIHLAILIEPTLREWMCTW
jgi:hypothetical protein